MNPVVIEVETGSERSSMNEGQSEREVNLGKTEHNVTEVFTEIIECPSTSGCKSKIHKQTEQVALPNDTNMIIVIGDVRIDIISLPVVDCVFNILSFI